jgi:hypothetical protein
MSTSTPSTTEGKPRIRSWLKRILAIVGILALGVLAVVLVLGLWPLSSEGMQSQPGPAGSYEEAISRFQEVEQAEQGIANDLGHSRLLAHGDKTPRAYVMVHGTTNSPEQWQELGETLEQLLKLLGEE